MAASSSSNYTSRCSIRCTSSYDVFLSFSGRDTRTNFTDHLYVALSNAGFRTFKDNIDLPRGENISRELQRAICNSRCSVIIFSKNYGDSESCLFELVTILQHKKTSDHIVLPVFYDIDPDEVRYQTGKFANAFARHEKEFQADISKVIEWRKALEEAANLAGMVLQNEADRHEAKFVTDIVNQVEEKIKDAVFLDNNDPGLVGFKSQLETINSWVTDGSKDAGILLICGFPGTGKTTLATNVYESNFKRFTQSSLNENIRSKISSRPDGLIQLQREILKNLTKRYVDINSAREGASRIKAVVGSKKVLLVLDDMDENDQIELVIGTRKRFYPGSKIIITTTQERDGLINSREVSEVHIMKQLGQDESIELFSRYAFGLGHPFKSHEKLLERVVLHCEGHPLALKVWGKSLAGTTKGDWDKKIKRLEDYPNSKITETLKLSYDILPDDHDKGLFLDIACFFIGEKKDFMVTILDGCGFYTEIGTQSLINRCLITIDMNNQVKMPNLLRDMGRQIARQESPTEPGKRTRLWNDKDSYEVLTEKKGEQTIEGIILKKGNISSKEVVVEINAYEKMVNLRLLIHSEVQLKSSGLLERLRSWLTKGNFEPFSKRLCWLSWRGFSLDSIPSNFLSESLVAIDMCNSNLTKVCGDSKCFPKLKILNFSHSRNLKTTLDFSSLPNLEELILSDCTSLASIHESICRLKYFHTLDIAGCSTLIKFPILEFCKMDSIKIFRADHTLLSQWLNNTCYDGVRSSLAISWPQGLIELSLKHCNLSDDDFSWYFNSLSSLRSLNLTGNKITRLPDCIKSLNGLHCLSLVGCDRLETLLELPVINRLEVFLCPLLKKVTFQPAPLLEPIEVLYSEGKLIEIDIEYWCKLEPIESFDIETINVLGLCDDLEYMKDIYINIISTVTNKSTRLPIQGIRERHGIFNVFFPGGQVPYSFSHKSRESSISICLPKNKMIQGLNVSTRYAVHKHLHDYHDYLRAPKMSYIMIEVNNSSKGLKWIYAPTFFGYHLDDSEDVIWLCHLKLGNKLEGGDEVTVSILVVDKLRDKIITFKECGIHVVYKQEEKMSTQSENTTDNPSDVGGICDYWEKFMVKPAISIIEVPLLGGDMGFGTILKDGAKSTKETSSPVPEQRQRLVSNEELKESFLSVDDDCQRAHESKRMRIR